MNGHGCTLVLGGSGFLGAHVAAVTPDPVRTGPIVAASRPRAEGERSGGVPQRDFDALRTGDVERLLEELAPARIVLCTALSRIADCAKYAGLARALNVELPRRVAAFARDRGARLVHVSTDLVFGAAAPRSGGFVERDAPAPMSVYGETKAAGERAVIETCPSALVVRLPLVYGPSGGRGLGASDSVVAAVERGERPALFTDEFRTPLDVRDAAAALIELCASSVTGILHVAGPGRVSRYDLGVAALRATGRTDAEARASIRAGTRVEAQLAHERPADVSLNGEAARRMLRTPLRAIEQALARRE